MKKEIVKNIIDKIYPKIQCLLHEYRHYLQSATWFKRYYQMGYNYSNHPYELAATIEESNWKTYAKKLGEAKYCSYIMV